MNIMTLLNALPGSIAQGLIWGVFAIGVYITFKVLDFADMTVDGSIATGGSVAVMMMLSGHNVAVALVAATIVGMLAGMVTGIFHVALGIPGILSGILSQLGLYSVNMRILGKSNQAISVDKYNLILSLRDIHGAIIVSAIFCIVVIALMYGFFGTEMGRAGGLYAQYQGNADVNMGRGAIVIGLASVIIAGVVFKRFDYNYALRMLGVVGGAILYYIVIAVVLWLGLETTDLKLISALIVAAFLALPHLKGKYAASHVKRGGGKNA